MQGLSDGYFIAPYTIGNYLASTKLEKVTTSHPEFKKVEGEVNGTIQKFLSNKGTRTTASFHKELGKIVWDECGMSRNAEGLQKAIARIRALREDFWKNVKVAGDADDLNPSIEAAGRVADYFDLAELMCIDALNRNESCGGHFREEYQTSENEALRNDDDYSYVAAWQYGGPGQDPALVKEPLHFDRVHPSQRSYK